MMTACRQCNKVLYDYYGLIPILFSVVVFFYSLLNLESSEMFRCGTARRPARGRMCGNTAQFAELISPSEGIRQTTTFSDLGIIINIYSASNRYTEERSEFASKLREPVDGCGNCGFWRDTLETCARCCQVSLDVGVMEKLKETWCVSLMTLDTTPPSSAGVILLLQM